MKKQISNPAISVVRARSSESQALVWTPVNTGYHSEWQRYNITHFLSSIILFEIKGTDACTRWVLDSQKERMSNFTKQKITTVTKAKWQQWSGRSRERGALSLEFLYVGFLHAETLTSHICYSVWQYQFKPKHCFIWLASEVSIMLFPAGLTMVSEFQQGQ